MSNTKEAVEYYLEQLRAGRAPFFDLLELGAIAIPELVDAYRAEADGGYREFLVEVIWQYRDPSAIPFPAEALRDDAADVWKEAIDGLVAMLATNRFRRCGPL
jgi:hypothetical protein